MKKIISLFLSLVALNAFSAVPSYYPDSFITQVSSGKLQDDQLKEALFTILSGTHQKDPNGGSDTIGCDRAKSGKCYSHQALGYKGARKVLFGQIHLENKNGQYFIRDVYCNKIFSANSSVGPGAIPDNNDINCEHTWPQSKFSRNFDNELQKSDLHHLFPTDSKANSTRGNYEFADVVRNENLVNCELSQSGASTTQGGHTFFEPPTFHKGNVARALFYFSVRYKMSINPSQEAFLRQWNEIDPVDQEEINRNDAIEKLQGNRNPFIDNPELVNQISDF